MRWEYTTVKVATTGFTGGKLDEDALTDYMNELGSKEWELVTAFSSNQGGGQTRDIVAVFKRPK